MSLVKRLLIEGKRDIIVNKIGLDERLADFVIKKVPKKFQIWGANIIKDYLNIYHGTYENLNPEDYEKFEERINEFISIVRKDNIPETNLRDFYTWGDTYSAVIQWSVIKDWISAVTPTPNLKGLSWTGAYRLANEWHNSLKASDIAKEITDVAPDAEIIYRFDDGAKWIDLNTNRCMGLKDIMGHCASTSADTILQLITPEGKYRVTVAFDYDGTYRQMKGIQNNKPDEKYTPYIQWLFTNGGSFQIKNYLPEYSQEDDFKVDDLPEDIYNEVMDKYPDLDKTSVYLKAESELERGNKEEAIELLNGLIGEKCGYGYCAYVSDFYHNDFNEVLVDYDPSDISDVQDFFKFGNTDISREIIEYFKNDDINELIDELKFEIDLSSEVDVVGFINSLTPSEVNKIVMEITKENPSVYKPLITNNREYTIQSILEKKVESDSDFKHKIKKITEPERGHSKSIKLDNTHKIVSEFRTYIDDFFNYCGFVVHDDNIYTIVNIYFDDYYEEMDNMFISHMHDDNIYHGIEARVSDYERDGDQIHIHENIKNISKELSKMTNEENSSEEILLTYLLDMPIKADYLNKLRQYLINIGYLDTTDVPATENQSSLKL